MLSSNSPIHSRTELKFYNDCKIYIRMHSYKAISKTILISRKLHEKYKSN